MASATQSNLWGFDLLADEDPRDAINFSYLPLAHIYEVHFHLNIDKCLVNEMNLLTAPR